MILIKAEVDTGDNKKKGMPMIPYEQAVLSATAKHKIGNMFTVPRNEQAAPTKKPMYIIRGNKFLDSLVTTVFVTLLTLLALIESDVRFGFCPKDTDEIFDILVHFCFSYFILESLLSCAVKEGYFRFCWSPMWKRCGLKVPWFSGSFFFWLDLISTLSLILEMTWFQNLLYGTDTTTTVAQINPAQLSALKRTAAARVLRFVRLSRVFRIAKLFERIQLKDSQKLQNNPHEQSKVGSHLSEQTTRKVVIMVLLMLLVVPLLALPYEEEDLAPEYAIRELRNAANSPFTSQKSWDSSVAWIKDYFDQENAVLKLGVVGAYFKVDYVSPAFDSHRYPIELIAVTLAEDAAQIGFFSNQVASQMTATYSLILTMVVLVMLTAGSWMFNRSTHQLVIIPIERMLNTIQQLRTNPLTKPVNNADIDDAQVNNETGILERTLAQLTGLLQVGFGEAGSRMIAKCMNTDSGDLDPLVDGTKMVGIFGFCDIRRFTDATECLKEDVMMYVNEIADIVHGEVKKLEGNPNKNVGDAFLLVWRLPEAISASDLESVDDASEVLGLSPKYRAMIADIANKSLISFLRVYLEIAASDKLKKYKDHGGIKKTFGDDFAVSLGFGLHVGWAIEGPIGSRYKIDASYLSPHVNMSETVQDFCKTYNVPLLMSGQFYSLLSDKFKQRCRWLDRIMCAGTAIPMNIYCCDIYPPSMLALIAETSKKTSTTPAEVTIEEGDGEAGSRGKVHNKETVYTVRDKDFSVLQAGIPSKFFDIYKVAIDAYVVGKWKDACSTLKQAKLLMPEDGPTIELLNYMGTFNETAPADWPGYRHL